MVLTGWRILLMKINWLKKQLKKRFDSPQKHNIAEVYDNEIASLEYFGYHNVYQMEIYLSQSEIVQYRHTGILSYPKKCCVCGKRNSTKKDINYKINLFRKYTVHHVPFCEEHKLKPTKEFIIYFGQLTEIIIKVLVISYSKEFILDLKRLNVETNPPMPWKAFPDLPPESSGWRQGDSEEWWHSQWRPYWDLLSSQERDNLIAAALPPEGWTEKLIVPKK